MDRQKSFIPFLILLTLANLVLTLKVTYSHGIFSENFWEGMIIPSISGLFFFLLSLIVFLYLPPRPGMGPLLAFGWLVGNLFILLPLISLPGPYSKIALVLFTLIPATMIHFTMSYSELMIEGKKLLLIEAILYSLSLFISVFLPLFSSSSLGQVFPVAYLVLASLFWLLGLGLFLRKPHPELQRVVAKALLIGQFLGIFLPLAFVLLVHLEKSSFPFVRLSPMILLFPLSLLIGIVPRKRELSQAYFVLSEKRTTSGNLLAGLAHEINNPMTFIYSSLEPLRESIHKWKESVTQEPQKASELSQEIDQLIDNMEEGARRAKGLIEKFRFFPYPGREEMKEVDLNQIISQSITLLSYKWKNRIRIEERLEPLPKIRCSPGEMGQVFTNLIANACEAIDGPGVIQVATHRSTDGIKIQIRDNGKGIPKNEILRIYDPFFTTKSPGEGTGLGLAITLQIIKNHRGKIEVKSELGKGTEFLILLPFEETR